MGESYLYPNGTPNLEATLRECRARGDRISTLERELAECQQERDRLRTELEQRKVHPTYPEIVASLESERDRLEYLHKLDHSLADQRQVEIDRLRAELERRKPIRRSGEPTEEGLYFVGQSGGKAWWTATHSSGDDWWMDDRIWWSGPIEPPEES
jgi:hypothetical protein